MDKKRELELEMGAETKRIYIRGWGRRGRGGRWRRGWGRGESSTPRKPWIRTVRIRRRYWAVIRRWWRRGRSEAHHIVRSGLPLAAPVVVAAASGDEMSRRLRLPVGEKRRRLTRSRWRWVWVEKRRQLTCSKEAHIFWGGKQKKPTWFPSANKPMPCQSSWAYYFEDVGLFFFPAWTFFEGNCRLKMHSDWLIVKTKKFILPSSTVVKVRFFPFNYKIGYSTSYNY